MAADLTPSISRNMEKAPTDTDYVDGALAKLREELSDEIQAKGYADTNYVDGALAKLREELCREIQRLDARMNAMAISNNDTVELHSVDLSDSAELKKKPQDPSAEEAVDITASASATMTMMFVQDPAKADATGAREEVAEPPQSAPEIKMILDRC